MNKEDNQKCANCGKARDCHVGMDNSYCYVAQFKNDRFKSSGIKSHTNQKGVKHGRKVN